MSVDDPLEDRVARVASAVADVRDGTRTSPRTFRSLAGRIAGMAKKVVEEATEVAVDARRLQGVAVTNESVDLFYNLVVLWHELGISPAEIWTEMDRRERELGTVEKLPKEANIPFERRPA
jgi:phosphoribosyl-ATP pyrophosphohydrolase